MSKVTLAITVVGGLVLFSGALILVGAVAMTSFSGVYEAAVFKTLGANHARDRAHAVLRVRVLGSLAGVIRLAWRSVLTGASAGMRSNSLAHLHGRTIAGWS